MGLPLTVRILLNKIQLPFPAFVSRRQQTVLQAKLRVHCGTFELSPHRRLYCRYSLELTLSDLKI